MGFRFFIGAVWLGAVAATVVTAFITRSQFAEVNALGGVLIVVGCAVGVGLGVALIRRAGLLAVTAAVAALLASRIAWSVLHDESSTAALGVIAPPFINGAVALVGAVVGAVLGSWPGSLRRP